MKNHKLILAILLAATPLLPCVRAQTAAAPAAPAAPATPAPVVGIAALTVTGALDYESQYVFYGKKVTDSAFQPGADLGYQISDAAGSIHASWWTSQPIGRAGNGPAHAGPDQTNEIDLGTYYDYPTDALGLANGTIEAGYLYYWYPDDGGTDGSLNRSQEVHLAFKYDDTDTMKAWSLSPQAYYYHDFILDSNTLTFAISHTFNLDDCIPITGFSLVPSANIGWTGVHRAFGDQPPRLPNSDFGALPGLSPYSQNWRNSYVFWGVTLELDYKLSDWCTAFGRLEYSGNNDGTAGGFGGANPQAPGTANSIWAGLGLSFGM